MKNLILILALFATSAFGATPTFGPGGQWESPTIIGTISGTPAFADAEGWREAIGVNDETGRLPEDQLPLTINAKLIPRNGTSAEIDALTLAVAEIAITTDSEELRVGDGGTLGGVAYGSVAAGSWIKGSDGGIFFSIKDTSLRLYTAGIGNDNLVETGGIHFEDGIFFDMDGEIALSWHDRELLGAWVAEDLTVNQWIDLPEQSSEPSAPSANTARIFTKDNGSGKTQLCVKFATGATQVIATQP